MRGPPSGRAQEGRRQPRDEVNGFRPHWRKAFTVYLQGVEGVNGPSQGSGFASVLKQNRLSKHRYSAWASYGRVAVLPTSGRVSDALPFGRRSGSRVYPPIAFPVALCRGYWGQSLKPDCGPPGPIGNILAIVGCWTKLDQRPR
jgi:hypothetical protein